MTLNNRDITPLFAWADVPAALGLLTRLPIRVDTEIAMARGSRAAWAYPIVGLLIGLVAASIAVAAQALGFSAAMVATIAVAAQVIVTGAMHEDGLADTADGLWGGWDVARRLEIMKDSHIGAYGVIALIIGFAMRWAAIATLVSSGGTFASLIAAAMISRAAMVVMMHALPNARDGGLSSSVGRPQRQTALVAVGIAALGALMVVGFGAMTMLIIAAIAAGICAIIATAKIKGQTGDILGATQQVTEITVLMAAVSLFAG